MHHLLVEMGVVYYRFHLYVTGYLKHVVFHLINSGIRADVGYLILGCGFQCDHFIPSCLCLY